MRDWLVALVLVGCGKSPPTRVAEVPHPRDATPIAAAPDAAITVDAAFDPGTYATLAEALAAIIPPDARVIGFGELHARVDRAQGQTSLSAFTAALPSLGAKISDLVVETWLVDPGCGKQAVQATAKIEASVKRPEATKSEVARLAEAAKAAGIQPHAMKLTCADYAKVAPAGKEPDPLAMLTLTTRELTRIATSAVIHRDKEPEHRPWIALYGGALHNDRFPDPAVAEWSYAPAIDRATHDHYVEIDVMVPELAALDVTSQKQPWFPLVAKAADRVQVWQRGERSFVVILAKSR